MTDITNTDNGTITTPDVNMPAIEHLEGDTDHAFANAIVEHIAIAALSVNNPRRIAENTLEWVKETFPARVYTAYWVTISKQHERDKGVAVEIMKLPLSLHLRVLVGGWSAGFAIQTPDYTLASLKVSLGVGLITRYDRLNDLSPVATFMIHF